MPLTNLTDYLPTMDLFLAHWNDTNAARETSLILEGGETRADLQAIRTAIVAANAAVLEAENQTQTGATRRDLCRKDTLPVARAARNTILGLIPSSPEAHALPEIPGDGADPEKQLVALRDLELIWKSLEDLPKGKYPSLATPLIVEIEDDSGKTRKVGFKAYSASVARLDSELQLLRRAAQTRTESQQSRQKAAERGRALLTKYAKAIRRVFPRTSATYRSLPKLNP